MEADLIQTNYAIDTFYFLVMGVLVMFMAPGFAMLEAGLVRSKNTTEILTKNVALFAVACTMYMVCGYSRSCTPGWLKAISLPDFGCPAWAVQATRVRSGASRSNGETYYSARSAITSTSRSCSLQPRCRLSPVPWPNA